MHHLHPLSHTPRLARHFLLETERLHDMVNEDGTTTSTPYSLVVHYWDTRSGRGRQNAPLAFKFIDERAGVMLVDVTAFKAAAPSSQLLEVPEGEEPRIPRLWP